MKTRILQESQIDEVVELIQNDEVVAFPTETVYGLGIKYNSSKATSKLIEAKQRDESKFFTLMVSDKNEIVKYAYITDEAQKLIDAFMPGDITIIFQAKEGMTNGPTIGIRIPDHAYTLSLLKRIGPMYVTSANLSGQPSANTTKEVVDQLDGRIAGIVDSVSGMKEASCVVNTAICDGDKTFKILRAGRITEQMILDVLDEKN